MSTAVDPAETSSLGLKAGFTTPNTLYPSILATVLLCGILTTLFTAARLIAKRWISTYDVEDYFLAMAWVASFAYGILVLVAGLDGLGHHVWDITLAELPKVPRLLQFTWALEILYIPAIWLAKSSLLFQLIRIFTPMKSGPVYWACHALIWGNLAFYVSILFVIIFECNPIYEVWNLFYGGHCINRNTVLVASSAVNIFSDLLNLLLPVWATWHLQMAPRRKAGITAIFATGILAFVSSICRLIYATRIENSADVSFIVVQIGLWALAEIATVILCTCFPMMPRLVKLISERKAKSKSYSTSPPGHAWKRTMAKMGKDENSSGSSGDSSHATGETNRLDTSYEQLGEEEYKTSGSSIGILRTEDIELAMSGPLDVRSYGDLLEQRLNVGFSLPQLSYP